MGKVKLGMIGLGGRGYGLLELVFLKREDIEFTVVCDRYQDRSEQAADLIEKVSGKRPLIVQDYKEILRMDEVEGVVLCTSWEHHIDLAIEAMEAGKYVGCEVGGAYSVQQCWKLVEAYERTKVPVMMLENCVYGRNEMMILHMARLGLLGDIVHCEGGYRHDLRDEIANGAENRHYRLRNYIHRNTENYPTHELGPIARILKINRGNRMLTLTAMASRAAGLSAYIKEHKKEDEALVNTEFKQGDIVTTMIKCAGGETILLTLDTTLPRAYSRDFMVQGTKGMYQEENDSLFLDSEHQKFHFEWKDHWGNAKDYYEKYDHPVWQKYIKEGVKEGHDGMDWLVFQEFVESMKQKTNTPIDVYDMAAWMSISALAEESIAMGSMPVAIPDFTNGAWISRQD